MINLIPNEEKKRMRVEFYFRLVVMFFVMLGFSGIVATFSLIPSYYYSLSEKKLAEDRLNTQTNGNSAITNNSADGLIENVNNQVKLILQNKRNSFLVSEMVIGQLLETKQPEIKINKISYILNETSNEKLISISGVAPSRDKLLEFKKALESNKNFKQIDLPISNFIKGTNINFDIKLKPAI